MRKSISFVSVLLGLIGLELVAITGDRGGELVFGHGVGVTAIQELQRELDEKNDRLAELEGATGPQIGEDGSWTWRIVPGAEIRDRKSTRLNSSHVAISSAVICLKKKMY